MNYKFLNSNILYPNKFFMIPNIPPVTTEYTFTFYETDPYAILTSGVNKVSEIGTITSFISAGSDTNIINSVNIIPFTTNPTYGVESLYFGSFPCGVNIRAANIHITFDGTNTIIYTTFYDQYMAVPTGTTTTLKFLTSTSNILNITFVWEDSLPI